MDPGDEWLEVESLDLEGRGVARRAPAAAAAAAAATGESSGGGTVGRPGKGPEEGPEEGTDEGPDEGSDEGPSEGPSEGPAPGAAETQGKVVFIEGALPGERVRARVLRRKSQWEQGEVTAIARASAQRVVPRCPHFGLHAGACGGCKVQHLHPWAQVAARQRVLEDGLWHLAKVRPARILPPIYGPAWGYRERARLSVRWVAKKGTVLVGFHERRSRYVADMHMCPVLPEAVSALLVPLRALVGALAVRERVPQIELACGEGTLALVLRHLEPLPPGDLDLLAGFGRAHGVQWWLQPAGPDSVRPLDERDRRLEYRLPEFGLTLSFLPTDFTQVNGQINGVLVARAVRLLAPQPHERVIDWFCGLGNFTLALATRAGRVLGLEGSAALVARAQANAQRNGLASRAGFAVRNLFELTAEALAALGSADGWLIDPPREGAFALVRATADLHAAGGWRAPRRIVYVSCNPATLARDAGLLVHRAGYRCTMAGVVNMFPHTAHVESVAVFERAPG
ncbi:MAG: 23S rRNA (uracil(1939)-C(5))-methyltransferase RlmD [Rubrivivax sp.]|nr:23S rRNA (uracil(1939)-C(5))-methyltransferase RlmD [Rubrivivax sp.]